MAESEKSLLFWSLADEWLTTGEVEKGTMMGFPCLRVDGKFFASLHSKTDDLIIKVPKDRVTQLIDSGEAEPFAPNGRTFKEWALVPTVDESKWRTYLEEARAFVEGS